MEKNVNILLVDDNDDDAFFVERAFQTTGIEANIARCIDGQEAISYLENKPPFSQATFHPRPDLVLLDLKLPVKDGLDVLAWIRKNETFSNLIVVVLTSSAEKRDIERAYMLHANAYITKPGSLQTMVDLARAIHLCWLQTCLRLRP